MRNLLIRSSVPEDKVTETINSISRFVSEIGHEKQGPIYYGSFREHGDLNNFIHLITFEEDTPTAQKYEEEIKDIIRRSSGKNSFTELDRLMYLINRHALP